MKEGKSKKMYKRIFSFVLSVIMVLTMLPTTVMAESGQMSSGALECHKEHDEDCGYIEGEQECTHVCEYCDLAGAQEDTYPVCGSIEESSLLLDQLLETDSESMWSHVNNCSICQDQIAEGGAYYEQFYASQAMSAANDSAPNQLSTDCVEILDSTGQESKGMYPSLEAALENAVANDRLKILQNIDLTQAIDIKTTGSLTIDLNGKKISGPSAGDYAIKICSGVDLTVTDALEGVGNGGTITAATKYTLYNENKLTLMSEGRMENTYAAGTGAVIYNAPAAELLVKGVAEVENTTEKGLGVLNEASGTQPVTLEGDAQIIAKNGPAIEDKSGGKIILKNDAKVTSSVPKSANKGTVHIPGTVSGVVLELQKNAVVENTSADGYVLYFADSSVTKKNVSSYYAETGDVKLEKNRIYPEPEDLVELFNGSGVSQGKYSTLNGAVASAKTSYTLKILDDIVITEKVDMVWTRVNSGITIDLNGKTISSEALSDTDYAIKIGDGDMGFHVTLTDSTGSNTQGKLTAKTKYTIRDNGGLTIKGNARVENAYESGGAVIKYDSKATSHLLITENAKVENKTEKGCGIEYNLNSYAEFIKIEGKGQVITKNGPAIHSLKNGKIVISGSAKVQSSIPKADQMGTIYVPVMATDKQVNIEDTASVTNENGSEDYALYFAHKSVTVQNVDNKYVKGKNATLGRVYPEKPDVVEIIRDGKSQGKYKSLKEAVTAAKANDTLKVIGDIELTEKVDIEEKDDITLDLNGKKISTGTLAAGTDYAIGVGQSTHLMVKDGSTNGGGLLTSTNKYTLYNSKGALTIQENATVENDYSEGGQTAGAVIVQSAGAAGTLSVQEKAKVKNLTQKGYGILHMATGETKRLMISGEITSNKGAAINNQKSGKIVLDNAKVVSSIPKTDKSGTILIPEGVSDVVLQIQGSSSVTNTETGGYAVYFADSSVTAENVTKYYEKDKTALLGAVYPMPVPSIEVAKQVGALSYGTAGSATFAITPKNIDTPSYSVVWSGTAPDGIDGTFNGNTLTMAAGAATDAGTYKFKVKSGTTESGEVTLTIAKVNYTPAPSKEIDVLAGQATAPSGTLTASDFFTTMPTDAKITAISGTADKVLASTPTLEDGTLSWEAKSGLDTEDLKDTFSVTIASKNYNDIKASLDFKSILKTSVSITGISVAGKTYDSVSAAYTGTPVAKKSDGSIVTIEGYTYTWQKKKGTGYENISGNAAPKDAGDYRLVVAVNKDNSTYTGSTNVDFSISKAEVTVKVDDKTMVVGGTRPDLTISYTGFAGTDSKDNALATKATAVCSADGGTVGDFDITIDTKAVLNDTVGSNYKIKSQSKGILKVTKIKLAVPTLTQSEYVYTGEEISPSFTGFDKDTMKMDVSSATKVGIYETIISLKSTEKYEWDDGSNKTGSWKYSWKITEKEPGNVLNDNSTGVIVEGVDGTTLDPNVQLVVEKIDGSGYQAQAARLVPGASVLGVYNVRLLLDNVEIQPDGRIKIKLPLTEEMKAMGYLRAFYIDSNGKMSLVDGQRNGDYMEIITDDLSISIYGIIGGETQATSVQKAPATGDTSNTMALFMLIGTAAFAMLILLLNRRRIK